MPREVASSSASSSKGKQPAAQYGGEPDPDASLFLPRQILSEEERVIKEEYDRFLASLPIDRRVDRRASFAALKAETRGDLELTEDEFAEVCRKDPKRIFELAVKILQEATLSNTEAKLLRQANAANISRLNFTQAELTAREDEIEFLQEEGKRGLGEPEDGKWRKEAEKRTAMLVAYKRLHGNLEAKNAELQRAVHDLQAGIPIVDTRETRPRSLSPLSRELADCEERGRVAAGPPPPLRATHSPFRPTTDTAGVSFHRPTDTAGVSFRRPTADTARSGSRFTDPHQAFPVVTDKNTPVPAPFSGQDRDHSVKEFVRSLEFKLSMTSFRTNDDGLRWVLAYLRGAAWRLCASRIPSALAGETCHHPFADIEEMLGELRERFGQKNTEGEALTAIRQLRQGPNQSFGSIYTRFVEYRSQIPYLSDAMEMDALQCLLNETYLRVFASQSPCRTAKDMVDRLLYIDEQQKKTKALLGGLAKTSSSSKSKQGSPPTTTTNPRGAGQYNEVPQKYRNMPQLTPELREQLMSANKCLRCRESGHKQFEAACPLYNVGPPGRRPAELAVRSVEAEGQGKEDATT